MRRLDWRDALLGPLILAITAAYLASLPRYLGPADEAVHLYDAKRILEGQVIYRDFFNVVTPGFMYLMAFLFRLFGTDIAVARWSAAALHGLTAALIFVSARCLGVRQALACLAAFAYLLLGAWAFPIASQHWLGTFLCALVLQLCIRPSQAGRFWPMCPGVALGLVIDVHQQRGLVMAAGVFLWLIADDLIRRRYGTRRSAPSVVTMLAALVAGALVAVVPLLAALVARAGAQRVWRALVLFPIFNYAGTAAYCDWGYVSILSWEQARFAFPRVLKYLPLILPLTAMRAARLLWERRSEEEAHHLMLLLVFCLFSVLSISYFPDFIHIAFITPPLLIAIAEAVEWLLRKVPAPSRLVRPAGRLLAAAALLALAVRLHANLERNRQAYPLSRSTAFGEVNFPATDEVKLYDTVNALMQEAPSRHLYFYPTAAHLYLLTEGRNPTPFGWFLASYYGSPYVEEALAGLDAHPPAYVVLYQSVVPPEDPIVVWIRRHYEPIPGAEFGGTIVLRPSACDH